MIEHDWILYIAAFATAFGISLFMTPYAKKISVKLGAIDYPRSRGMHKRPIPRMGGIAIVSGFLITMAVLAPFLSELRTRQFLGFIIGAILIVAVGIWDDVKSIRPRTKLVFQIVAAMIVIFSGTTITTVTWPFMADVRDIGGPLTLIWIVGVTNAVNLIDGVDGLAAGVSSICALCLTVLCIITGSPLAVVLSATLAGSCFGFLPRNFSPAEIIMGDTGALFLGYVLSVTSIIGVYKAYALLSVAIACFTLALPIMDTLFAMLRRALKRKPITEADRGHLHHRLIDAGLSHSKAVVSLYVLSFLCGLAAIALALENIVAVLVIFIFTLVMIMMLFVYRNRTAESDERGESGGDNKSGEKDKSGVNGGSNKSDEEDENPVEIL